MYRKANGVCVADATKKTYPCIGDIFVGTVGVTTLIATTRGESSETTLRISARDETSLRVSTPGETLDSGTTKTTLRISTPGVTSETTLYVSGQTSTTGTTNATQIPQQPIVRETLSIANMSLHQCACASGRMAAEIGLAYGTQVFPVSCEVAESSILCVNFTCPCVVSRRLLQANATQYKYVRKSTPKTVSVEQLAVAVRLAVPAARVMAVDVVKMDTTVIKWDDDLGMPALLQGFLVVIVFVIVICLICWWACASPRIRYHRL
jgi:hypothetical protein